MAERIWDRYLTEQDRAHVAAERKQRRIGFGRRPALLMVDLYRWVYGDEPEPLLESVKKWPGSCGLAGWEALPPTKELLGACRAAGIPVCYVTGLAKSISGMPGWSEAAHRDNPPGPTSPEMADRKRRQYDIMEGLEPLPGELILRKNGPSAFWSTPLMAQLTYLGVDTLLVAGESTSGCVRASVVDAVSSRLRVTVVEECVFDRHQATHALNLFDMDQKYADVLPLQEVLPYIRQYGASNGNGQAAGPVREAVSR
jgi:nicotinamidase-related amidase